MSGTLGIGIALALVSTTGSIVVAEQSIREGQQVVREVVRDIERSFHITHTTVQVEVEGCEPNDLYCGKPQSPEHSFHRH